MIIKNKIKIYFDLLKKPLINKNKFIFTLFLIKNYLKKYFNKKNEFILSWVNNSKILIERDDYFLNRELKMGLSEFEDMSFLLHVLKKKHIFIDCGANVGLYTILASKVIGAKSFAFEPSPKTFSKLEKQVVLNKINNLVNIKKKALGKSLKEVSLVVNNDANQSVTDFVLDNISSISKNEKGVNYDIINKSKVIKVLQTTLDHEMKETLQDEEYVVKIDIQGGEHNCILGSEEILRNKNLIALIIENKQDGRYKLKNSREETFNIISGYNLYPVIYDPFKKEIKKIKISKWSDTTNDNKLNYIFIRNFNYVQNLCKLSQEFLIRPIGNLKV